MMNHSKKILIFFFFVCVVIFIVIAQIGKKAGSNEPYTTSCTTDEERCAKCKIYQLQMQRMQGTISDKDFLKDSSDEANHIKSLNCNPPIPCPPNCPPVPGDSCKNLRTFSLSKVDENGNLEFSVFQNKIINGKCQSTERSEPMLTVFNSPIKSFPLYNRTSNFEIVSYSNSSDPNLPFSLSMNYTGYTWTMESNAIKYPDSSFAFLIPDSVTNKVYMVKPSQKGSKTGKIFSLDESIKPKLFNYYKEKENENILFVFDDIIRIFAHDPNAKVILLIDSPSEKKLIICIKGSYNGRSFLLCTGYNKDIYLGLYNPFQLNGGFEFSGTLINNLTSSSNVDKRLYSMILSYGQNKGTETIRAALPSSFSNRITPLRSIGNPDGSECVTNETKQKIQSGEPVDLLTEFEQQNDFFSWKYGSKEHQKIQWINENYDDYKGVCQLLNLGIIDNSLRKVAEIKTDTLIKLVFFFKNSAENLYCWTIRNGMLKENVVLNGQKDVFQLTGTSCFEYLTHLKEDLGSGAEKQFYKQHSDRNSFELLDGFNLSNPSERIILWSTEHQPVVVNNVLQTNIYKLGENVSENKLKFLVSDSKVKDWKTFIERYNDPKWVRNKLLSLLIQNKFSDADYWFGNGNRFGICTYRNSFRYMSVYLNNLDNLHREIFGERAFKEILDLVKKDEVIFISGREPTEQEFFESCLKPEWNKTIWRANPLGYFDRKN